MNMASLKNLHWKEIDWKSLRRNKKIWFLSAALLIAIAGAMVARQLLSSSSSTASTAPALQTAVARLGDLTVFTSGAGKVIPATEISVGFQESGVLSEILVGIGDKVEAGQVLARLQTDRTEESISAAIASAELAVLTAQKALDDLVVSAEMTAAQALLAVEEAQQALEDLENPDLLIAQAQQAVAEA